MLPENILQPHLSEPVAMWLRMGSEREKTRFKRHMGSRQVTPAGGLGDTHQSTLDDEAKEFECKRWNTTYSRTHKNFGAGQAMSASQTSSLPSIDPIPMYLRECINSSYHGQVENYAASLSPDQKEDFIALLRSFYNLSLQSKTAFKSEYGVEFRKRSAAHTKVKPLIDPFASSLGKAVEWAPPKKREQVHYSKPDPRVVEAMRTKKAIPPSPNRGILTIAGGVVAPNSRYRDDFHVNREVYDSVIPKQNKVTTSTLRLVPSVEVPRAAQQDNVILDMPMDNQSRKMLKQRRQHGQPSWHLLYPSVHYTEGSDSHDHGEKSIYGKDFKGSSGKVKPAQPTIDPFASSIQIKMSDKAFHYTEYEETLGRSAVMDRSLI